MLLSNETIWILEDDPGSVFVYEEILKVRHPIRVFPSLRAFKGALESNIPRPDLIIADLRLEDDNFMNFLAQSNSRDTMRCPFIIVSSMDDLDVLRSCFHEGALDYLTKPFGKAELIVKVEKLLDAGLIGREKANHGAFAVDIASMEIQSESGRSVRLTMRELQIFTVLERAGGNPISRKRLFQEVWSGTVVGIKTLDVHIFNLRRKLEQIGIEIQFVPPDSYCLESGVADRLPHSGDRVDH